MPLASTNSLGDGLSMPALSHIVTSPATPLFHNLCVPQLVTECDIVGMDSPDKNGGPNYLRAWREFRAASRKRNLRNWSAPMPT